MSVRSRPGVASYSHLEHVTVAGWGFDNDTNHYDNYWISQLDREFTLEESGPL